MKLQGRVALVTGAAQGIGAAIVREFLREGAAVAAIDRKTEVRDAFQENTAKVYPYVFDITDHEAYRKCVENVVAEKHRIDILVNDAAICFYGDVFEDSLEKWRKVQAVNLEAIYWGCKLVAPHMAKQCWGRIISISSTQAIATEGRLGSYTAAKGAIMSLPSPWPLNWLPTASSPMRLRRAVFIRRCRSLTAWMRPKPNCLRNGTWGDGRFLWRAPESPKKSRAWQCSWPRRTARM